MSRTFVVAVLLMLPVPAFAQEATIVGTVSDSTGGVLPGVTIKAVHDATSNSFETVTDSLDAPQGRSTGVQVNAITKSGTNTPAGARKRGDRGRAK